MQHFFVKENQIKDNKIKIIGKDVNHIKNVLRCKLKEKIEVSIIETEEKYLVEILELNNEEILCEILKKVEGSFESNVKINIIQGLPKSDKMEFIIQKCTELGVKEITPLELERCVVKLVGKDLDKKLSRWENIAETAAKQCGRNSITRINKLYSLKNIEEVINGNDLVIVAYEGEKKLGLKDVLNELKFRNLQQELSFAALSNFDSVEKAQNNINDEIKIAIIVGPEGGLEEREVEFLKSIGVKLVSLGRRILRTETVAVVLSGIVMYELGEFGEI